jgi:hypothetical protein
VEELKELSQALSKENMEALGMNFLFLCFTLVNMGTSVKLKLEPIFNKQNFCYTERVAIFFSKDVQTMIMENIITNSTGTYLGNLTAQYVYVLGRIS